MVENVPSPSVIFSHFGGALTIRKNPLPILGSPSSGAAFSPWPAKRADSIPALAAAPPWTGLIVYPPQRLSPVEIGRINPAMPRALPVCSLSSLRMAEPAAAAPTAPPVPVGWHPRERGEGKIA